MESIRFFFRENDSTWMLDVFVIVFATLVAGYLAGILFNRLEARFANTKNLWDDAMLEAVRAPVRWLILLQGLGWAVDITGQRAETSLLELLTPMREIGLIIIVTWFLIRVVKAAERRMQSGDYLHRPLDRTTASALGRLVRGAIIITSALVTMQALGYSISSVLAFGGIGGLAVGFAAKDLLSNFFGGVMIYLDRPFSVGDWIRSPDRQIEGVVEDIGWRLTTIRTFDKRPLYVPNQMFTTLSVENPSRMLNRRIYETIGIRYDDAAQVGAIVAAVREMLKAHPDIDQKQTLIVNFNCFGPSSLDFFVYTFTKTTNWVEFHAIKENVLLKILAIIEAHGAEIAYPTQTLKVDDIVHIEQGRPRMALEH